MAGADQTHSITPVVLGGGRDSLRLSRRLAVHYGTAVHLFVPRPPLYARLCPWLCCHPLPRPFGADVLLPPLFELADALETRGRTPLLLLAPDLSNPFPEPLTAQLETRFIVRRAGDKTPIDTLFSEGDPS